MRPYNVDLDENGFMVTGSVEPWIKKLRFPSEKAAWLFICELHMAEFARCLEIEYGRRKDNASELETINDRMKKDIREIAKKLSEIDEQRADELRDCYWSAYKQFEVEFLARENQISASGEPSGPCL